MGFLVAPANLAAGQAPPPPVFVDRGVLILELGAVDQFRYIAPDATETTQAITTAACKVSTSGALATLSPIPSTGTVGMFADGIGVQTKGEKGGNGQPCGQANGPSEGLILELAGQLAGYEVDFSELDIEGKFNVTVDFGLYRDGSFVANGAQLTTGTNSDSGPDSGDGDNYRHLPDAAPDDHWDEMRIVVAGTTPSGAFSLEGGADGTAAEPLGLGASLGTTGSVFKLVERFDGEVDCGGSTITVGDSTNTAQATFTRGDDDAVKGGDCQQLILYNLDSTASVDDQTVTFEFETEEAPSWFGTFTWAPEPASMPVDPTQFDDGATSGDLLWCDGFDGIDGSTGNPKPVLPENPPNSGEFDPWCLIEQTTTLLGSNSIQVTQTIYGESDPSFARPK